MVEYKRYRNKNVIRDWEQLIKMDREDVEALQEEWESVYENNKELSNKTREERDRKIKEVEETLREQGVEVMRYSSHIIRKPLGYFAWFKKNVVDVISRKYPVRIFDVPVAERESKEVLGVMVTNNKRYSNVVELYDTITRAYKRGMERVRKDSELLVRSIDFAREHNIEIDGLFNVDIIKKVDEVAKEVYREEEVPVGTELYLDHECYECDTYIVGERRCRCGNRRIYIEIEGDILDGYYHLPTPF